MTNNTLLWIVGIIFVAILVIVLMRRKTVVSTNGTGVVTDASGQRIFRPITQEYIPGAKFFFKEAGTGRDVCCSGTITNGVCNGSLGYCTSIASVGSVGSTLIQQETLTTR